MKKLKGFIVFLFMIIIAAIIVIPRISHIHFNDELQSLSHSSKQTDTSKFAENLKSNIETTPLKEKGHYQLVLHPLDSLGRAVDAHIQLNVQNMPKAKREPRLTYNPVGWHNYKFDGKWLMNRGHLVGYQFSGLNDEPKNLVPETAYFNAGSLSGMDDSNTSSMLYYENRLAIWLKTHPKDWLDYQVTPIYKGNELIPRKVRLSYIGYDEKDQALKINIGGHESQNTQGITTVELNNTSPNASINYSDGTAKKK